MRFLPLVPASGVSTSAAPRFASHSGTALLLWRAHEVSPAERPSIAIASEEVVRLPCAGVRAVIAPGFDARFFSEAVRQGILPVSLPDATIAALGARIEANPHETLTVDLDAQSIEVRGLERFSFEILPRVRRKLLHGLDDLDELLEHRDVATAFRTEDSNRRPWLYASGPTTSK
jgi:hypothetical protein